jgi:DnaJ family protein C protein 17
MSRKHADPNGVSTSSSQKHNSRHMQPQFDTAGERRRSLKASWTKSNQGKDYTVAQLKRLFEQFGPVQDVVVKDKPTKGTAIVVMKDPESLPKALSSVCGDLSNPLLVTPLSKDAEGVLLTDDDTGGKGEEPPPGKNQNQKNTSHLSASFENDVLAKLRAAAKRKREAQPTE